MSMRLASQQIEWTELPTGVVNLLDGYEGQIWSAAASDPFFSIKQGRGSHIPGQSVKFDNLQTFGGSDSPFNPVAGAGAATFLVVVTPVDLPSGTTEQQIIGRWGSSAGPVYAYSWGVLFRGATVGFYAGDGGSSTIEASSATSYVPVAGVPQIIVVRWNGALSGASRISFYINGKAYTSTSWYSSGTFSALGAVPLVATTMGYVPYNGASVNSKLSNSHVHAWAAIRGDIGDQAALNLSSQPYSIAKPQRILVPVSTGGTTPTLVIGDILCSLVFDNLALSVDSVLSVSDTSCVLALDNLGLSTTIPLTTADTLSAVVLDNLGLSTSAQLAAQDTISTLLLDNLGLSSNSLLAAQDTISSLLVDNAILTSASVLFTQDTTSSLALDNVVLATSVYLAVQEMSYSLLVDNISISTSPILAVQDTLSGLVLDNLSLTSAVNLAIQDSLSTTFVDSITLTNQVTLAIAEMSLGLVVDNVILYFDSVFNPSKRVFIVSTKSNNYIAGSRTKILVSQTRNILLTPSITRTTSLLSTLKGFIYESDERLD